MTVRELKTLLKGLPNDMPVVMILDDEALITVCKEKSSVVTIMDEEEGEEETLLLLLPCGCGEEPEIGEINSQPELN